MKKKLLICSIVILVTLTLITQKYRIFYTYGTNIIDSIEVVIRTNVITGETEMLNPLTLVWIDSNTLLELKDENENEERENRINAINDEIQRYQDILDGKVKLDPKSVEYIFAKRRGVEVEEYLKNEIDELKNDLDDIENNE